MKRDNNLDMFYEGRIFINLTPNKKSVQIEVDKKGCEFLIEELTDLLNNNKNIVEYDSDTGYNCGILTKESLGIIINWREK